MRGPLRRPVCPIKNGSSMKEVHDLSQFQIAGKAETVALLKAVLAQAEQGQITTVGFIGVGPMGQIATSLVGPRISDVFVGMDLLKSDMLAAMRRGVKQA